jgi:hypothetical protein
MRRRAVRPSRSTGRAQASTHSILPPMENVTRRIRLLLRVLSTMRITYDVASVGPTTTAPYRPVASLGNWEKGSHAWRNLGNWPRKLLIKSVVFAGILCFCTLHLAQTWFKNNTERTQFDYVTSLAVQTVSVEVSKRRKHNCRRTLGTKRITATLRHKHSTWRIYMRSKHYANLASFALVASANGTV